MTIKLTDSNFPDTVPVSWENLGGLYDISDTNPEEARGHQSLDVDAKGTPEGPMAFAVYRAPPDYVRVINGTALNKDVFDPQHPSSADTTPRSVTFKVTSAGTEVASGSIKIWRPPVVMVHGLWDDASLWNGFLAGDGNQRFSLTPVSWADSLVGKISPSGTDLMGFGPTDLLQRAGTLALRQANTNQLGIQCNAPKVQTQITKAIDGFRGSRGVAATQADVVAHSMGGLMTRKVENLSGFEDSNSFGVGRIHKLITAGTPYLGSPLATDILNLPVLAPILTAKGRLSFGQNVSLTDGSLCGGHLSTSGAIYDLQGDMQGIGGGLSPALDSLMRSSGHAVPTHVMAGKMDTTNFVFYPPLDPPGTALSAYNSIFGGWPGDGIVSVTSQLALTTQAMPSGADITTGLFHSAALLGIKFPVSVLPTPTTLLEWLTFQGLAEFSPQSGIVARVISLLQQPQEFGSFVELMPPLH